MTQTATAETGTFDETRVGLDHLAFEVANREELERWVSHLEAHGVSNSGIIDGGFGPTVVFRDPDNIQLEFFVHPSAEQMAGMLTNDDSEDALKSGSAFWLRQSFRVPSGTLCRQRLGRARCQIRRTKLIGASAACHAFPCQGGPTPTKVTTAPAEPPDVPGINSMVAWATTICPSLQRAGTLNSGLFNRPLFIALSKPHQCRGRRTGGMMTSRLVPNVSPAE